MSFHLFRIARHPQSQQDGLAIHPGHTQEQHGAQFHTSTMNHKFRRQIHPLCEIVTDTNETIQLKKELKKIEKLEDRRGLLKNAFQPACFDLWRGEAEPTLPKVGSAKESQAEGAA